jgi:hypothetical protein
VVAPRATVHSYGLLLEHDGFTVLITTDTRFDADLLTRCYARADVIFHDCETGGTKTSIHAHYDDLAACPEVRARMWLYDYQPGPLPDARADGFQGFVRPGQCFELSPGAVPALPARARRTAV